MKKGKYRQLSVSRSCVHSTELLQCYIFRFMYWFDHAQSYYCYYLVYCIIIRFTSTERRQTHETSIFHFYSVKRKTKMKKLWKCNTYRRGKSAVQRSTEDYSIGRLSWFRWYLWMVCVQIHVSQLCPVLRPHTYLALRYNDLLSNAIAASFVKWKWKWKRNHLLIFVGSHDSCVFA